MKQARALKFVRYAQIQSHLRRGWMTLIPNDAHRGLVYGIEMAWLCDCPIPCEIKFNQLSRVPSTPTENEHERA